MLFEIVNWDNNGDNLCFQMAARQRRRQNEQVPPPHPPSPTVQELMAQQNEILRKFLQRQPHPQRPAAATSGSDNLPGVPEHAAVFVHEGRGSVGR
jgi:hypothetical protein